MPVDLVMPMAGRGSRFLTNGDRRPKPLIDLEGRPFFWWAVESVRRSMGLGQTVFVVLQEHEREWRISERIRSYYPNAEVVALPDVTKGAAETAAIGLRILDGRGPVAVNDCDHAFVAGDLNATVTELSNGSAGALLTFRADSPAYSYIRLDERDRVTGTVEKQVASPYAIAGCYLFASPKVYLEQFSTYAKECDYEELFISGIYNGLLNDGESVAWNVLTDHFAFGTPKEFETVRLRMVDRIGGWV
ncbi:MAG: NTP transferase domain-containing protein [Fimbriimonas sp.]|nr:NTP transferase domain-containing protein [Fimbriimonas sp.]